MIASSVLSYFAAVFPAFSVSPFFTPTFDDSNVTVTLDELSLWNWHLGFGLQLIWKKTTTTFASLNALHTKAL